MLEVGSWIQEAWAKHAVSTAKDDALAATMQHPSEVVEANAVVEPRTRLDERHETEEGKVESEEDKKWTRLPQLCGWEEGYEWEGDDWN